MVASPNEVLAVAAVVYDQETHSDADMDFLLKVNAIDKTYVDALNTANKLWGGGSETWQAVKRLAARSRADRLARALAEFEAQDDLQFAEAAE